MEKSNGTLEGMMSRRAGANGSEVTRPPFVVLAETRAATAQSSTAINKSPSIFEAVNADGAVLIGAGTRIVGDIENSSLVEIRGQLEGNVVTRALIVREGGGFKGQLQTENAEVHGTVQGTVRVNDLLDIRSTGAVAAEAVYGRLTVSTGGSLAGNIQVEPPSTASDNMP